MLGNLPVAWIGLALIPNRIGESAENDLDTLHVPPMAMVGFLLLRRKIRNVFRDAASVLREPPPVHVIGNGSG